MADNDTSIKLLLKNPGVITLKLFLNHHMFYHLFFSYKVLVTYIQYLKAHSNHRKYAFLCQFCRGRITPREFNFPKVI